MMINHKTTNHHVDYLDVEQHWSPKSEKYAGGDGLVTALDRGWEISGDVRREEKQYAGLRTVTIYHVPLVRGDETMTMPVLHNPYVNRLLRLSSIRVVDVQHA